MVKKYGECCRGADPMCTGGCLVEKAIRNNGAGKVDCEALSEQLKTLLDAPVSFAQAPAPKAAGFVGNPELRDHKFDTSKYTEVTPVNISYPDTPTPPSNAALDVLLDDLDYVLDKHGVYNSGQSKDIYSRIEAALRNTETKE